MLYVMNSITEPKYIMKLSKINMVLSLVLSISIISYAQRNGTTEQAKLSVSPNELKMGEQHTAQVENTAIHYKRESPVSTNNPSPKVRTKLEKMKAMRERARQAPDKQSLLIYSPGFAKRFNLDLSQAETLGNGLYAMELIIEKEKGSDTFWSDYPNYDQLTEHLPIEGEEVIPHNREAIDLIAPHGRSANRPFHFNCYLNLYLDSELPISYAYDSKIMEAYSPLDSHCYMDKHGSSPNDIYNRMSALFRFLRDRPGFVWPSDKAFGVYPTEYQDEFGIYQHVAQNDMRYKVYFTDRLSTNKFWPVQSTFYPAIIRQYKKNFVPGVNYLSLGPFFSCDKIAHALPQGYILLEKRSGAYYGPYFETRNLDLKDFYYFKLPKKLLEWPALQLAVKREDSSIFLDLKNFAFYLSNH